MGTVQEKEKDNGNLYEKCVSLIEDHYLLYAVKDGKAEVVGEHNGYTIFAVKGNKSNLFVTGNYAGDFWNILNDCWM